MSEQSWYDKWYKIMLVGPLVLLAISLIYLGIFYSKTGDFIIRDVSLSGGTTITLSGNYNADELKAQLSPSLGDVIVRTISDRTSGKDVALIIESKQSPEELKSAIETALDIKLTEENSSVEFSGPSLGNSFYRQLIIALIISFALMSIVIFLLFKTFIPSIAVIFAAFADIAMSLALVNLLGIPLSAAGIAAFLMLIGYSVDTDILLTTRAIKKSDETLNKRIYSSFKTGGFMTLTALVAVLPAFLIITGLPDSFRQIFLILTFGLFADLISTWLTNAGIIKWYAEKRGIK